MRHLPGILGHEILYSRRSKERRGKKDKVQAFALKVFLYRRDLLLP